MLKIQKFYSKNSSFYSKQVFYVVRKEKWQKVSVVFNTLYRVTGFCVKMIANLLDANWYRAVFLKLWVKDP